MARPESVSPEPRQSARQCRWRRALRHCACAFHPVTLLDSWIAYRYENSGGPFPVKIIFLVLALLATLPSASWSDIPPPRPTTVTVTNLAAFPKFKFSYAADTDNQPKKFIALRDRQVFKNQVGTIRLYVEDGNGERVEWASIVIEYIGKSKAISILDVRRDGKTIKVNYKLQPDPGSREKSAGNGASPVLPFMLSGFSLGAVVLLMRRKRMASTGS